MLLLVQVMQFVQLHNPEGFSLGGNSFYTVPVLVGCFMRLCIMKNNFRKFCVFLCFFRYYNFRYLCLLL